MNKCSNPDCNIYPFYGVAPHICYYKLGLSIGQSFFFNKKDDPDNFVRDKYDPECGTYFCPECKSGKTEFLNENSLKEINLKI